ncbi:MULTISPECIES: OmpA family protein [Pseudomonas]|uniref:OmpA family protein n=1 Tax=Pseudomonas helleri TaxID=1608996 RepID=A0A6L5HVJ7_9PSED|nr:MULTISPECIES: OmpA family protein [Pseudomonas]MQT47876.1 OmpA family protein [Pseudomonas helleri]MQT59179.1 OmpA family protein [Pseudomonas sp. FSL R10-0399]MQT88755.1 OmpA family protein [Pseudomonas helleri]MQU06431.1 OmpA family protein [Pseudomonas helleri]
MRTHLALPACFALSLVLTGCASNAVNPNLEQARQDVSNLQNHPQARQLAAIETEDAAKYLNRVEQAVKDGAKDPEIDHMAYLAEQRVALALQTIELRATEKELEGVSAKRAQTRLEAREAQIRQLEEKLNAKQTDRGSVVTFGNVLFDLSKADLMPAAMSDIRNLAKFLQDNPQRKVMIEGFTDSTGADAFNLQLSQARADSVRHALVREGVSPGRIETVGLGKAHPVADNNTPASRAMNRRVEVTVSHDAQNVPAR